MSDPPRASVRSTVYLEPELHRALRLKSAHGRKSMSEIVNDEVRQALREHEADLAAVRFGAQSQPICSWLVARGPWTARALFDV